MDSSRLAETVWGWEKARFSRGHIRNLADRTGRCEGELASALARRRLITSKLLRALLWVVAAALGGATFLLFAFLATNIVGRRRHVR
jgi:hypothetical protein